MDNLLIIILAVGLLFGLALLAYIATSGRKSKLDKAEFRTRWQRIESLSTDSQTGWQLAIIEADKLLDAALKANGYPGQTMGDRLKDARSAFRNNDQIWQAHKLRNRLAHEHDVRLNSIVVRRALRHFKSGLKDLGAL